MVWDYPINDTHWINLLTTLVILSVWVVVMSVIVMTSVALGRGLRYVVDQIVAWDARHAIQ